MSDVKANLWSKLSAISRACSYVQKDGTNQFHRYNYATAANIYEKVNLALFDHGVASFVEMQMDDMREKPTSKGLDFLVTVRCLLTLVDCETGEKATTISYGSGADPSDKAIMKAQTAALKYAWINLLNISTGDDPEADEKTDARAEGTTIKAKKGIEPRGSYRGDPEPTEDGESIFDKLEAEKAKVSAKIDAETTECPKCGAIIETFDSKDGQYRECHTRHMDRYEGKKRGDSEATIKARAKDHYFKWMGNK